MVVDAAGKPIRYFLTEGQAGDSTQAKSLMRGLTPKAWLADKAYDTNAILERIQKTRAVAVIPPTAQRKVQREYDKVLYKERNKIERLFNGLKQFRRIATRHQKNTHKYLIIVNFAAISVIL